MSTDSVVCPYAVRIQCALELCAAKVCHAHHSKIRRHPQFGPQIPVF